MDRYDELIRRLRARMDGSSSRERSLDWRAADAIETLQARAVELEQENARLRGADQACVEAPGEHVPLEQPAMVPEVVKPLVRALSLQDAAELLGVSYGTVFENRRKLGFSQVGRQWRIWPDVLRESLKNREAPRGAPIVWR